MFDGNWEQAPLMCAHSPLTRAAPPGPTGSEVENSQWGCSVPVSRVSGGLWAGGSLGKRPLSSAGGNGSVSGPGDWPNAPREMTTGNWDVREVGDQGGQ